MSAQSQAGKAAWMARAATYPQELSEQITAGACEDMHRWAARGRVPIRVRIMACLAGRPVQVPQQEGGRRGP